jgi:NADP-dependent 3-hydroxy acid dehydrogenase YdfG
MKLDGYRGQVVMITGAASGFGARLATELAGMGARLVPADRNAQGLERVAEALHAAGTEVLARRCDVTSEADAESVVVAGVQRFGQLDVGINNAGILMPMKSLRGARRC